MPQYTQIILDYLEYADPELYESLRDERLLLRKAQSLATEMADEADRLHEILSAQMPHEQARVEAEARVIEEYLPMAGLQ